MRVRTEVARLRRPRRCGSRAARARGTRCPPGDGRRRVRRRSRRPARRSASRVHGACSRRSTSSPTIAGPSDRRAARVDGGSFSHRASLISRRTNRSAASAGIAPRRDRIGAGGGPRPPVEPRQRCLVHRDARRPAPGAGRRSRARRCRRSCDRTRAPGDRRAARPGRSPGGRRRTDRDAAPIARSRAGRSAAP